MKLYTHGFRNNSATERRVPYKRGPFTGMDKIPWEPDFVCALVDEATDPPTLHFDYDFPSSLPYQFLIRAYDGALLTGDGRLIFAGSPKPQ